MTDLETALRGMVTKCREYSMNTNVGHILASILEAGADALDAERPTICILIHEGQTAYGPFKDHTAAIEWAEHEFDARWAELEELSTLAVEPVPNRRAA